MILLLVRPPTPYLTNPNMHGPLGLGALSAYVRREMPNVSVEICDMAVGDELREADVFGWTSTSLDYDTVVGLAHDTRRKYPSAKHIIGGSHASVFREKCDGVFDAVFVGEAEKSLVRWLKWVQSGEPAPEPDRVRSPEPITDLDSLPFTERKRPGGKQLVSGHDKSATIMGSRGCPFSCAFCATDAMWGRRVRMQSPERVVAEMRHVRDTLGVTDFAMIDDVLTVNLKWLYRFCDLVKDLDVKWRALSRVDISSPGEVFHRMHLSGCTEICFGVESFDDRVLFAIGKKANSKQAEKSILIAHYLNLHTRIFMMISTPGESPDTADINIDRMEKIKHSIDLVNLATMMPLPGTPIYDHPEEFGVEIVDKDLSHHNRNQWIPGGESPVYSPIRIHDLTREQQYSNIRKMRDYVGSLQSANRGIPT